MDSPPVPGELLVDIFLRLPDPADLVRASAACVSFRRLVADRSFLRQYRRLHAPPLLGFLGRSFFQPATAPHPSAPAASAVARVADFSFAFLPGRNWLIKDVRDGRVLLYRIHRKKGIASTFIEIVACDPLHRQYLLLPPIPDEVFTSVEIWHTFLAPPADIAEKEEETAFRVIWMARRGDELISLVFSTSTGKWQDGPSHSWSASFFGLLSSSGVKMSPLYLREYVYGSFYWMIDFLEESKLLVLDTETMEFSIAEPPPEVTSSCDLAMVEAGEGRLGMFMLSDDGTELNYIIRKSDGGSSSQWKKVRTVSLGSRSDLICNTDKYLLLHLRKGSWLKADCFTLDIETFKLEKVCPLRSTCCELRAYTNFPPSLLSSPTISSGSIREDAEKPMLEQDVEVLPAEAHSHPALNTTDAGA